MGVRVRRKDIGLVLGIPVALGLCLGMGAPGAAMVTGAAAGTDEVIVSCDQCHRTEPGFSHPVGMVPSMAIPSHLPLEGGRMTCRTCHDDPGAQGHVGGRTTPGSMLRATTDPEGFCIQCHRGARSLRSRAHGTSFPRAHLRWPRGSSSRRGPPDPTRSCQSCHDGSVAREAEKLPGAGGGHPVGMPYATTRSPLQHEAALPDAITVVNGRVGCTSCHSPYSELDSLLVMPNRDSRLCLSCHRL
jgi:predicted CXXCH cytochrome family protein